MMAFSGPSLYIVWLFHVYSRDREIMWNFRVWLESWTSGGAFGRFAMCVLLQCCYVSSRVVLARKFIILRNWIEFLEFTE